MLEHHGHVHQIDFVRGFLLSPPQYPAAANSSSVYSPSTERPAKLHLGDIILGASMSALFNFQSLLLVILLLICTCTYIRAVTPRLVDSHKQGFLGIFFMSARIGERLSPYVALACVAMAVRMILS